MKVCIAKYLYALIMILVFTAATAFGQVKVVHFNAGWNSANDVEWFDKLSDANKKNLSIDDSDILKYNIGYCDDGLYSNRIIIPSYDSDGQLNFFVGRAFFNSKLIC